MTTTVFAHNSAVQRSGCAGCGQPATWTLSATVGILGTVKSDMCDFCFVRTHIPAWGHAAEARVMRGLEQTVREAME